MKKLIIIMMMIPLFLKGQNQITFGTDKLYHAGAGHFASASMVLSDRYLFEREMNPIAPTLIAIVAGTGKEMYDAMNGGKFSGKDLLWTAVSGAITNIIMPRFFDTDKKRNHKIWLRGKRAKRNTIPEHDVFDEFELVTK